MAIEARVESGSRFKPPHLSPGLLYVGVWWSQKVKWLSSADWNAPKSTHFNVKFRKFFRAISLILGSGYSTSAQTPSPNRHAITPSFSCSYTQTNCSFLVAVAVLIGARHDCEAWYHAIRVSFNLIWWWLVYVAAYRQGVGLAVEWLWVRLPVR